MTKQRGAVRVLYERAQNASTNSYFGWFETSIPGLELDNVQPDHYWSQLNYENEFWGLVPKSKMQLQEVETSKGPRLYEVSWQNYSHHQRHLWPCNIWHITCDNSSIIQQYLRRPFLCALRSTFIAKIVFIFTLMKRGCWVEGGWSHQDSVAATICGMMKVKLRHVYVTFISIWITPVDIRVILKYPLSFILLLF
jgi:hypothetical protein